MIIVDRALSARAAAGRPVRVGMVGAGFVGHGLAKQIVNSVPGMELAAISNRHVDRARRAYAAAGVGDAQIASSEGELAAAVARRRPVVTDDALALCRAEGIDVVVDVTGAVEFGARVATEAIAHGKHLILVNAELDATVGPALKARADRAGVVVSGCDGDQPGAEMNLYRWVRGAGMTPLLCGNIKGLQDHYRTPATQAGFAQRWGMNAEMVTSFADGSKISFEQAVVANATGMRVAQRGMLGYEHQGHVDDLTSRYDVDALREHGGIVDYVLGAKPGPGVFVLATQEDAGHRHYLDLYKMGEGPLYCFYTPFHICHFEMPFSIARAALFGDPTVAPLAGPVVDVIATAKADMDAGTVLDGIGGYHTYGQCENSDAVAAQGLLPMGLAEGCRLRRAVRRDEVLAYADVELPAGRLSDALRAEQNELFAARRGAAA